MRKLYFGIRSIKVHKFNAYCPNYFTYDTAYKANIAIAPRPANAATALAATRPAAPVATGTEEVVPVALTVGLATVVMVEFDHAEVTGTTTGVVYTVGAPLVVVQGVVVAGAVLAGWEEL